MAGGATQVFGATAGHGLISMCVVARGGAMFVGSSPCLKSFQWLETTSALELLVASHHGDVDGDLGGGGILQNVFIYF